jgi:hypothetical protein
MAMLLSAILCGVVGRCTANSYIDNVDLNEYLSNPELRVVYCDIGYDEDTNKGFIDGNKVDSVEDLQAGSSIVVKVKLDKNYQRQKYYECILSQVEIEKVYQGDLRIGDKINIFEPIDCYTNRAVYCTDGYSMMQNDFEYILFLQPLKNTFFGENDYVYAPSSTTYGKYLCEDSEPRLFKSYEIVEGDEAAMLKYSEIKNEEVFLYDEEQYNKYIYLKKQVLEKFN